MKLNLDEDLARRIRTAAALLVNLSEGVPKAPKTVCGVVASVASGSPEAAFPPDDAIFVGFLAGELEGLAVGLNAPLPLVLVAAGIEEAIAADEEAMTNARSMAVAGELTRS